MIKEKVRRKGVQPDGYGRMVEVEYDIEKVTAETVGDILDLLAPYSREASVFMIPPKEGDNIQQVQIFDVRKTEIGIGLHKPIVFTIGTNGPHNIADCYKKQGERESSK